jgi:hypothetical protein
MLTLLSNSCLLLFFLEDIFFYFFPSFVFFFILFVPIVAGVFLITLIWSMVYAIRRFKQYGFRTILPGSSHFLMLWLLFQVDFTPIWLDLNFANLLPIREAVVALVQSGQLQPNSYGQLHLPLQYSWASCEGSIEVRGEPKTREIMFYTFIGIDTYAGYVYSENHQEPNYFYREMRETILGFKKYNNSWYWISVT